MAMVSQDDLRKRRVKAAKQHERSGNASSSTDRRRSPWIIVGVFFLAFILIAPLAAGLFAAFGN